jgi:hypothetical protein
MKLSVIIIVPLFFGCAVKKAENDGSNTKSSRHAEFVIHTTATPRPDAQTGPQARDTGNGSSGKYAADGVSPMPRLGKDATRIWCYFLVNDGLGHHGYGVTDPRSGSPCSYDPSYLWPTLEDLRKEIEKINPPPEISTSSGEVAGGPGGTDPVMPPGWRKRGLTKMEIEYLKSKGGEIARVASTPGSPGLGCANRNPVAGGKWLLFVTPSDAEKFLGKLGYSNNHSASASRSSSGDHLFVMFDDHAGLYNPEVHYKVAIVSSNGVTVNDLPGQSRFNDEGTPVLWTTWSGTTLNPVHFANGYVAPADVYCYWRVAGQYIGFIQDEHCWIARPESPLEELVFDRAPGLLEMMTLQLTVSWKDRLHLFVSGFLEGKVSPDRRVFVRHYEYQVERNNARLVQVRDFYANWTAQDFDPDSGLLLASSWDVPSAHGLLIDTRTGRRKELRSCHGSGYFVTDAVAKRFRATLGNN